MARVTTHYLNAEHVSIALMKKEAQLFSDWILLKKKLWELWPWSLNKEVLADAAYDDLDIRQHLKSRGIQRNILINPKNTKTRKRGRSTRFNGSV